MKKIEIESWLKTKWKSFERHSLFFFTLLFLSIISVLFAVLPPDLTFRDQISNFMFVKYPAGGFALLGVFISGAITTVNNYWVKNIDRKTAIESLMIEHRKSSYDDLAKKIGNLNKLELVNINGKAVFIHDIFLNYDNLVSTNKLFVTESSENFIFYGTNIKVDIAVFNRFIFAVLASIATLEGYDNLDYRNMIINRIGHLLNSDMLLLINSFKSDFEEYYSKHIFDITPFKDSDEDLTKLINAKMGLLTHNDLIIISKGMNKLVEEHYLNEVQTDGSNYNPDLIHTAIYEHDSRNETMTAQVIFSAPTYSASLQSIPTQPPQFRYSPRPESLRTGAQE